MAAWCKVTDMVIAAGRGGEDESHHLPCHAVGR